MPSVDAATLSASGILGEVCAQAGITRDRFHDVSESLERFVDSLNREAGLHDAGQLRVRNYLQHCLRQRLELSAAKPRYPGSFRREIKAPVFILGLPRTGATLLHHLMAQDEENRTPRLWEQSYPLPPPEPSTYQINPRIAQTRHELEVLHKAHPELRGARMISAEEPDDCARMFGRCLMDMQMLMQYHVPGYARWFWEQPLEDAYRWYRDELLLLQTNVLGNWVLRSTFHMWGIETLAALFPGASFVCTHREPLEAFAAGAGLCETLRIGQVDEVDPLACGRDWSDIALRCTQRFEAWRSGAGANASVIDVGWRALSTDPIEAVAGVYRALGRKLGMQARMRMRNFLAYNPGYAQESYRLEPERHGIEVAELRRALGDYHERYGAHF